MSDYKVDTIVIGAGAVGLAIAEILSRFGKEVIVLESEDDFGKITSSRNSGVIHAGIYYLENSLKAKFCVEGNKLLYDYCQKNNIPFENTKKLLVASSNSQIEIIDEIQKQVARDVAITARVLKLANARSGSTKLTITSISQAVVYLGEDSIRQLVRVLALSELGADKPSELTKLALTRAQFIALLLGQNHAELVGQGYLVGLFSVMDAILDTDLEAIVKEFSLDESIAQALLNNEGILGQSLALIRAFELDEMDKIAVLMPAINSDLHIGHIFNYVLDALLYSDEIIEAIAE